MNGTIVAGTSKLHIYSSFTLSSDDQASLSLLYTPLIGSDAFSLYMVFHSLVERNNLKSEEIIHQDLFDLYSLKASDFMQSRSKLEGIGLLITYEKNDEVIYVLCPPLSPKNFINNAIYGLYLYSKVREECFRFIKKHFEIEKPNVDEFENVTKAFDEVFTSRCEDDAIYEKFSYLLGRTSGDYLTIKNNPFDFNSFLKEINTDFLEVGVTKEFERQISIMAFVYNFDERQMAHLYMDSINKSNIFDYRLLKKKAITLFSCLRNMSAPKLVEKKTAAEGGDIITWLDSVSPEQLLSSQYPDFPAKYLDIINDVYSSINLPRGVLNCMILKMMMDKGGELPTLSYFKKVSESWIQASVLDTKDAVAYITTMKTPQSQKKGKNITSSTGAEIIWEEL